MKTKIFLLLLMIASIAAEASDYKIIIRGGGRHNKYYEVILTNDLCKCTGVGNNDCPIKFGTAQSSVTNNWYNLDEVTSHIADLVGGGKKSGEIKYQNDLPVRWKMFDRENIEINIENSGIRGLEKYDVPK
jgi:hypothetical protein